VVGSAEWRSTALYIPSISKPSQDRIPQAAEVSERGFGDIAELRLPFAHEYHLPAFPVRNIHLSASTSPDQWGYLAYLRRQAVEAVELLSDRYICYSIGPSPPTRLCENPCSQRKGKKSSEVFSQVEEGALGGCVISCV